MREDVPLTSVWVHAHLKQQGLEWHELKGSCAVLRGLEGSNALRLPTQDSRAVRILDQIENRIIYVRLFDCQNRVGADWWQLD